MGHRAGDRTPFHLLTRICRRYLDDMGDKTLQKAQLTSPDPSVIWDKSPKPLGEDRKHLAPRMPMEGQENPLVLKSCTSTKKRSATTCEAPENYLLPKTWHGFVKRVWLLWEGEEEMLRILHPQGPNEQASPELRGAVHPLGEGKLYFFHI